MMINLFVYSVLHNRSLMVNQFASFFQCLWNVTEIKSENDDRRKREREITHDHV